ncbi:MAG TPA: SMP-30/gluconolactonase/LRE family protein [Steroidobacteraceae bacterium]|nr:SMP-30/gluconolactonase/LRE family protein [Steroidobacteraceae bacterium]
MTTRQATVLTSGLYFGEGPRWHQGRLWFSDFHEHAVKSVDPAGQMRTELELDGPPSGLGWLPDGRLLVVAMHRRHLLRLDPDGLKLHADLSSVAAFHTNDMVVDGHGRAYVGNFGFDLDAALKARGADGVLAEHPTARLARVDPDGKVHVAAGDLHFPNGCVIAPDGRTLIVAETLALRLTAFDIAPDGSLSNRRVWATLGMRAPDGICLDANGHVWIANAIGPECVLFAPGGEIVETVQTSQPCFACMLGGPDRRTLYMMTAPSSVAELAAQARQGAIEIAEVATPGAGWP